MSRASDLANLIAGGNTTIFGEAGVTSSDSTGKTTNLQQGLAKAWINLNGTGTIATRDSFNESSVTDDATGKYTINFTNNMGNANYSVSGSALNTVSHLIMCTGGTLTTSTAQITSNTTSAFGDNSQICASIDGDLA